MEINNSHPDVISDITYVDLAHQQHRLQPEGIESDEIYNENDSYNRKNDNDNEIQKEKVVYATIKQEMPMLPIRELLLEKENILDEEANNEIKACKDVTDRGYISPQKILDPTCVRLHEDRDIEELFNKKLPPEPICLSESDDPDEVDDEEEVEELRPPMLPAKKIPPPVPELHSPLDLQDVEFADASDDEDENKKVVDNNEQIIPDAMTHDEAERLLSSRYVFFLQILLNSLIIIKLNIYFFTQ